MKVIKTHKTFKSVILIFMIMILGSGISSCSKKTIFKTSSVVPAARGDVKVKKDNNNNYKIEMKISYIAEPERLNPPMKTYVVWLTSEENNPVNIGQIIGTNKLHVKFETVSAIKPKRIFVTAEQEATTQYPSNMIVLESDKL